MAAKILTSIEAIVSTSNHLTLFSSVGAPVLGASFHENKDQTILRLSDFNLTSKYAVTEAISLPRLSTRNYTKLSPSQDSVEAFE